MSDKTVLKDIEDLNLAYLLLAQRLLEADYDTALVRLKIDNATADAIGGLSARQLGQLVRTNQLLFRFCLDDADQVRALTDNPRGQGLERTHTALLMASSVDT